MALHFRGILELVAGDYYKLFDFYKTVGSDTTSSDGELEAIFNALKQMKIFLIYYKTYYILSQNCSTNFFQQLNDLEYK